MSDLRSDTTSSSAFLIFSSDAFRRSLVVGDESLILLVEHPDWHRCFSAPCLPEREEFASSLGGRLQNLTVLFSPLRV